MPDISLKAEKIFTVAGFPVSNSFLSSLLVLLTVFLLAKYYYYQFSIPIDKRSKGFFLIHYIVESLYDFYKTILGDNLKVVYPVILSFFFYILFVNWFGLLPGVGSLLIKVFHHGEYRRIPLFRGGNADLNTTTALAFISVFLSQYYGITKLGGKAYLKKFYNLKNPISLFTGTLEVVSEFSKMVSFSFRLFGNIFAGEVLMAIIAFLVPVLASFPFLLMELFVGFIQTIVFVSLTAVFFSSAMSKH